VRRGGLCQNFCSQTLSFARVFLFFFKIFDFWVLWSGVVVVCFSLLFSSVDGAYRVMGRFLFLFPESNPQGARRKKPKVLSVVPFVTEFL
jgi:hypothetical protein